MRHATHDDTPAIVKLARPFVDQHPMLQRVAVTDEQMAGVFDNIIERGVIIVAEAADGALVGMLAGCIAPLWIAPHAVVAAELAWWMDPAHRHGMTAVRMVRAFEDWSEQRGAAHVVMSSVPSLGDRPARLIKLLGYQPAENSFAK